MKIVVGYDGTEPAHRALERTATIAKAFDGTEVIVISVAPVVVSVGRSAGPIDSTDPPEKHAAELDEAGKFLAEKGVEAETIAAIGHPADTIVDIASEREADLIVVGTRELGVVERVFGQSVSNAISHKAHCDVLIVH
jgi:nucleotide-binding universal stress UspA family protein